MTDLTKLKIAEARDLLKKGDISARELTEAYISAVEAADALNAYVAKTPEMALEMADKADAMIKAGGQKGMTGIPVGIKDLFATKGVHTQACSHILDGFKPEYESTVSQKLWDDGAVMLGKLNMDEFAMGSSNETSYYGPVKNPWRAKGSNNDFVPGGSSGGSVASVAGYCAMGATASDTGGSIRQPAAFTGTFGINRPTGVVRATAWWPLPQALTRLAPSPATCVTARSCLKASRALTRRTAPPLTCRCRTLKRR